MFHTLSSAYFSDLELTLYPANVEQNGGLLPVLANGGFGFNPAFKGLNTFMIIQ
jgi:hypothetical protein